MTLYPALENERGLMTEYETQVLITEAQSVGARRYFEFGTFLGRTTYNLAMNAPEDAIFYTLDVPEHEIEDAHPYDVPLTRIHRGAERMVFEDTPQASRIFRIRADSRVWRAPREFYRSMDFIFIDGGHDERTLRADTMNALLMLRTGGVIAWHDYNNPLYPEVTLTLDTLFGPLLVGDFRPVPNTMLALLSTRSTNGLH